MRLGALLWETEGVGHAIQSIRRLGLSGTGIAIESDRSPEFAGAVKKQFEEEGVSLFQVHCYTNLECAPGVVRDSQMENLKSVIRLAARAGARCVVSGCGHMDPDRQEAVFAAHPDNWTDLAMGRLSESCAEATQVAAEAGISFCVEPWSILTLNTPAALAELLERTGTRGFGILLDPVNLMTLDTYFDNRGLIQECFDLLGDAIRIVHAKDTRLVESSLTYHMSEVAVGEGILDYDALLECLDQLSDPETPLIIEHVATEAEAGKARDHLRAVAERVGVAL